MNIFLIRHGQTALNQSNTHQYSSTPLSENGLKQARSIAARLKEARIDVIYSSPLLRAKQTAEIISQASGKAYALLEELREIKRPSEIEGKDHDDPIVKQIKRGIKENFSNKDWHHSDEENFWDVQQRVANLMELLEGEKSENILLVTHGVVIKMLLSLCLFKEKLSAEEFLAVYENMNMSNTGITHCRFSNESGWKIVRVNDTTHLDSI